MKYKYLIIDDEPIAHDIIKGYGDLLPNYELVQQCYDAIEAMEYLNRNSVDLIFLDLNMPKLKGFDFLKSLIHPPKVIVTTAYQEYALDGYELNVVDYLLKPFGFERFLKAINKFQNLHNLESNKGDVQFSGNNSLFVYTDKKHVQLHLNELLFVEAEGNYSKFYLEKETQHVREKISSIAEVLPNESFVRVHKSYIVSLSKIKCVEGNMISILGFKIPVGKLYKANLDFILKLRGK